MLSMSFEILPSSFFTYKDFHFFVCYVLFFWSKKLWEQDVLLCRGVNKTIKKLRWILWIKHYPGEASKSIRRNRFQSSRTRTACFVFVMHVGFLQLPVRLLPWLYHITAGPCNTRCHLGWIHFRINYLNFLTEVCSIEKTPLRSNVVLGQLCACANLCRSGEGSKIPANGVCTSSRISGPETSTLPSHQQVWLCDWDSRSSQSVFVLTQGDSGEIQVSSYESFCPSLWNSFRTFSIIMKNK